jgi:glycosyltransferase involved in cell wall biosynthesis
VESNQVVTGYVPHGLNHNIFKPIDKSEQSYKDAEKRFKKDNGIDFMIFWNNRNIRRKQPGDLILAFKHFVDQLPENLRQTVGLLMHTEPIDENGTDLIAVHKALCPDYKVIFSREKISAQDLNLIYNVADVVVNIGSNEGWGLSSTEAILSGTPIINNVTGGLQDQCGFVDEHGDPVMFTEDFATNHTGKYKSHGAWVKPVFPTNRSLQGSPTTPYIFDDRVKFEDVSDAIMYWYNTPSVVRDEMGYVGREWALANGLTGEQMGNSMIEIIDYLFSVEKEPRPRFTINQVKETKYNNPGVVC